MYTPNVSTPASAPTSGKPKTLSSEALAIREYVMGSDGLAKAESTILLHVSHSNLKKTFFQEIRLDLHMTIERVKHKLEFHTGTSAVSNQIYLYDDANNLIAVCEDDKMLGYYSPYDGCRLHIIDDNPNSASAGGWLEDTSLVKKYQISEEAYNSRENTYRAFKAKKQAEDPNWTFKRDLEARAGGGTVGNAPAVEAVAPPGEDHQAEAAARIKVGDRCEAAGGRRGEVMFVGKVIRSRCVATNIYFLLTCHFLDHVTPQRHRQLQTDAENLAPINSAFCLCCMRDVLTEFLFLSLPH